MSQDPNASPELLEQLRRERALIDAELDELGERHDRMVEAQGEDTFSGHLRRAIHRSGRLVRDLAAEAQKAAEASAKTNEQLASSLDETGAALEKITAQNAAMQETLKRHEQRLKRLSSSKL